MQEVREFFRKIRRVRTAGAPPERGELAETAARAEQKAEARGTNRESRTYGRKTRAWKARALDRKMEVAGLTARAGPKGGTRGHRTPQTEVGRADVRLEL